MVYRSRSGVRPPGAAREAPGPSGSPGTPIRRGRPDDGGLSDTHATLLLVVITIILAAIILLLLLGMLPCWSWTDPPEPPIIITAVSHVNAGGGALTCASRVTLKNNSSTVYENDCLKAVFYRDGQRVCIVQTLNGHLFIPSHHYGVKTIGGKGCQTPHWNPGETMLLDLSDNTFWPGVQVTVVIVDKRYETEISKHTVRV